MEICYDMQEYNEHMTDRNTMNTLRNTNNMVFEESRFLSRVQLRVKMTLLRVMGQCRPGPCPVSDAGANAGQGLVLSLMLGHLTEVMVPSCRAQQFKSDHRFASHSAAEMGT